MALQKKNRAIFIDKEAISALSLAKEGLLYPVVELMNSDVANRVDKTKLYKDVTFPFSFILSPSGKKNQEILENVKNGEILDLICEYKKYGEIVVDEVFKIDPIDRIKKLFGSTDIEEKRMQESLKRLGKYAICGNYTLEFEDIKLAKEKINNSISNIQAKVISGIMIFGKPIHRAHERIIRLAIDKSDLVIIFLLKPYDKDNISFELRLKSIEYLVNNFFPKNRIVIVPLEHTYLFSGNNEMILDAIVAQNFGCTRLVVGQNRAGLSMFYDKHGMHSVFDMTKGIDIEIDIMSEFVYCNACKTLVSTKTCPHGGHHQISYHSNSIMELLNLGLLPPAILMRKEISALILNELFPNRFKNLNNLYYDIVPASGLLEEKDDIDFYLELMNLYQTSSLT